MIIDKNHMHGLTVVGIIKHNLYNIYRLDKHLAYTAYIGFISCLLTQHK